MDIHAPIYNANDFYSTIANFVENKKRQNHDAAKAMRKLGAVTAYVRETDKLIKLPIDISDKVVGGGRIALRNISISPDGIRARLAGKPDDHKAPLF